MEPDAVVLERKIIGVQIRAARKRAQRTSKQVALRLGISQARLRQYEMGVREISLPELEILASFLDVPVTFFLSNASLARREPAGPPNQEEMRSRRGLIATMVKQARLDAHKSELESAEAIGRTVERLRRYEAAQTDIPITELERLARFLSVGLNYFLRDGPARSSVGDLPDPEVWCRLPPEIRALVMDQNSLPFLRMAAKLRDLPPSKLQEFGEILLVVR